MTRASRDALDQIFRRIIVALDASGYASHHLTMEHAAQIAQELESELSCIFIEDQDLLHYAGLPFAREFSRHGGTSRTIGPAEIQSEMQVLAQSLREGMETLAHKHKVASHFQVVHGRAEDTMADAASDPDLLIVSSGDMQFSDMRSLCERARRISERSGCALLLDYQGRIKHGPVALLIDTDTLSLRALHTAARFARNRRVRLEVFLHNDNDVTRKHIINTLQDMLRDLAETSGMAQRSLDVHFEATSHLSTPMWRQIGFNLLVLDCGADLPSAERLDTLSRTLRSPILVLQGTGDAS